MPRRFKRSEMLTLVTVAIAEDIEHARDCQRMLSSNDIECVIKPREMDDDGLGVPIMVTEECAGQARAILAVRNRPDDFFDFGFDDAALSEDEE